MKEFKIKHYKEEEDLLSVIYNNKKSDLPIDFDQVYEFTGFSTHERFYSDDSSWGVYTFNSEIELPTSIIINDINIFSTKEDDKISVYIFISIILFLIYVIVLKTFAEYYFIPILPFFAILISRFIKEVDWKFNDIKLINILVIIIVLNAFVIGEGTAVARQVYYYPPIHNEIVEVSNYVQSITSENDNILVEPWELDDDKGDIIFKYKENQIAFLKKKGLIKETPTEEF